MFDQYGEILTIDEVCDILLVGRGRVYAMLREKELPGFRVGEVWKIPKKGVEEFILQQSGLKKANR